MGFLNQISMKLKNKNKKRIPRKLKKKYKRGFYSVVTEERIVKKLYKWNQRIKGTELKMYKKAMRSFENCHNFGCN